MLPGDMPVSQPVETPTAMETGLVTGTITAPLTPTRARRTPTATRSAMPATNAALRAGNPRPAAASANTVVRNGISWDTRHWYTCRDSPTREDEDGGRDIWYGKTSTPRSLIAGAGATIPMAGITTPIPGDMFRRRVSKAASADLTPSVIRPAGTVLHSECSSPQGDTCRDLSTVREYTCSPAGIVSTDVPCEGETACGNGVCQCLDSDGGWDYYEGGRARGYTDACLDEDTLREYGCGAAAGGNAYSPDLQDVQCPFGCYSGPGTAYSGAYCRCDDTDGGRFDYTTAGEVPGY